MTPEQQRQVLTQRATEDRRQAVDRAARIYDRRRNITNDRINHWMERYHAKSASLARP